jgi:hypothetical protein
LKSLEQWLSELKPRELRPTRLSRVISKAARDLQSRDLKSMI